MYPFHQLHATVINRRSLYGFSFATAVVRVPMKNSVHVKMVDGFGQVTTRETGKFPAVLPSL